MKKVLLRADHVGSLLRSDQVKIARKSFYEKHTIDKAELTEIEDQSLPLNLSFPGFLLML